MADPSTAAGRARPCESDHSEKCRLMKASGNDQTSVFEGKPSTSAGDRHGVGRVKIQRLRKRLQRSMNTRVSILVGCDRRPHGGHG